MKIKSILAGLVLALTSAASAGTFKFQVNESEMTRYLNGHTVSTLTTVGDEFYLADHTDYSPLASHKFIVADGKTFSSSDIKNDVNYTILWENVMGGRSTFTDVRSDQLVSGSAFLATLEGLSAGQSWTWYIKAGKYSYGLATITNMAKLPTKPDPGSSGNVPEPTSGLMLLLGAGMLALRRKRLPAA